MSTYIESAACIHFVVYHLVPVDKIEVWTLEEVDLKNGPNKEQIMHGVCQSAGS